MRVRQRIREVVIAMVLPTDMQLHFTTITQFRMRSLHTNHWTMEGAMDWSDVLLVLKLSLKVSTACSSWSAV